jgi:hypothetical protein
MMTAAIQSRKIAFNAFFPKARFVSAETVEKRMASRIQKVKDGI